MENANMPAHVQEPDSCQIGSYHMYDTQEEIFGKGISSNFNHRKVQIYDKTGAARQYREGVEWTKATLLGSGAYSCCYQARDVLTPLAQVTRGRRRARIDKDNDVSPLVMR